MPRPRDPRGPRGFGGQHHGDVHSDSNTHSDTNHTITTASSTDDDEEDDDEEEEEDEDGDEILDEEKIAAQLVKDNIKVCTSYYVW